MSITLSTFVPIQASKGYNIVTAQYPRTSFARGLKFEAYNIDHRQDSAT